MLNHRMITGIARRNRLAKKMGLHIKKVYYYTKAITSGTTETTDNLAITSVNVNATIVLFNDMPEASLAVLYVRMKLTSSTNIQIKHNHTQSNGVSNTLLIEVIEFYDAFKSIQYVTSGAASRTITAVDPTQCLVIPCGLIAACVGGAGWYSYGYDYYLNSSTQVVLQYLWASANVGDVVAIYEFGTRIGPYPKVLKQVQRVTKAITITASSGTATITIPSTNTNKSFIKLSTQTGAESGYNMAGAQQTDSTTITIYWQSTYALGSAVNYYIDIYEFYETFERKQIVNTGAASRAISTVNPNKTLLIPSISYATSISGAGGKGDITLSSTSVAFAGRYASWDKGYVQLIEFN